MPNDPRQTTNQTTAVTRDGDVVIGGKWVGTVIREPGPPPNWTVLGSSGNAISWHYLRRDAVEEVERRHGNG